MLKKFSSRPDLSPQKLHSHYLTAFKAFNHANTIIVTVGPPCARQIIPRKLHRSHRAIAFHYKNSFIPSSSVAALRQGFRFVVSSISAFGRVQKCLRKAPNTALSRALNSPIIMVAVEQVCYTLLDRSRSLKTDSPPGNVTTKEGAKVEEMKTTPTLKGSTYPTGRGGVGNMARLDPERPEEARQAQDVDVPPILLPEGQNRTGRGKSDSCKLCMAHG